MLTALPKEFHFFFKNMKNLRKDKILGCYDTHVVRVLHSSVTAKTLREHWTSAGQKMEIEMGEKKHCKKTMITQVNITDF